MKVIVASKNPVKINSIKNGFNLVFPNKYFDYTGISVDSEISDQPMSAVETYQGAQNRIKNAIKENPVADFYCGIEGGLEYFENQLYAFAWIIIENKTGIVGKSKTASFMLPSKVSELIKQGYELGDADDIVFGQSNSKQKQGAVGILTNNLIDRTKYYTEAVILALIPFRDKLGDLKLT